ncbi:MAG: TIR domain-containing protein [Geminicoccaceae bacterium]
MFVSYASSNGEAFAHNLREQLKAQGFSVWHDHQDMKSSLDGRMGWPFSQLEIEAAAETTTRD